jgi:hypothetical protein
VTLEIRKEAIVRAGEDLAPIFQINPQPMSNVSAKELKKGKAFGAARNSIAYEFGKSF